MDHLTHTFGRDTVDSETRRARVRALFDAIAGRYDLMNDLMSGGMHRRWKTLFARGVARSARGPIIDLAGGTGDIAGRLQRLMPETEIAVVDPSPEMLAVCARRFGNRTRLVVAEGENLPFADNSIGTVTLSFGLRNMTDPRAALAEINRVLVPGGEVHILEFSVPDRWFAPAYGLYSRYVIPALGAMVAGNRGAYRYLVESISAFPDADAVATTLRQTGFDDIDIARLMFGVAAIHRARKG
ncbi:MAG: ubiquinone/menaquinone biosynthesis methyltransferase [Hyphomicrobiales bacterium]|nr:ubiquinone/menaquinone biosynthesis methyltransferase [Hyphomicrobiales bacterium]